MKNMPRTNIPAYFAAASVTKKKVMKSAPGGVQLPRHRRKLEENSTLKQSAQSQRAKSFP